jgi:hypothetical protein
MQKSVALGWELLWASPEAPDGSPSTTWGLGGNKEQQRVEKTKLPKRADVGEREEFSQFSPRDVLKKP